MIDHVIFGAHLAVRAYHRSAGAGHIRVDFEWTPSTVEGGVR